MSIVRVCATLIAAAGLLSAQFAGAASVLPAQIRAKLDRTFPGWRLPALGAQIMGCNPAADLLIRGDFDGDGLPDYAVEIIHGDELIVVAFLANGEQQVLARISITTKAVDQALDVLHRGERISDGPIYPHDAVIRLDCSGPATVTYFSVRGGRWHSDVQVTE